MKISWGHKIIFAYTAFVAGIMLMVYLSTKENRDLVSEDYYADELTYQKIIDQSAKTASLSAPPEVVIAENFVEIQFPAEFNNTEAKGKWELYYAAEKSKDQTGQFTTGNGKLAIPLTETAKGFYQLKLQWESGDVTYYFEEELFL
jgi:hypothetical protein